MDYEIFSLGETLPVYKLPNYREASTIFDRFEYSISLYNQDGFVGNLIDFLSKSTLSTIKPSLFVDKFLKSLIIIPEFRNSLAQILLSYFALKNVFGIIYPSNFELNQQIVRIPLISIVPASKVKLFGPSNDLYMGITFDSTTSYRLKRYLNTNGAAYKEEIESVGLHTYIERQASRKEDLISILDEQLLREIDRAISDTFIVKKERSFIYTDASFGRYSEPFIFGIYPYIEVFRQILAAKSAYYLACQILLFALYAGGAEGEVESQANAFHEFLKTKRLGSGVFHKDSKIEIISAFDTAGAREALVADLNFLQQLIISVLLSFGGGITLEPITNGINIKLEGAINLLNSYLQIISKKESKIPFEPIAGLRIILSEDSARQLFRFRDRGDISRTTFLDKFGYDIEKEASKKKYEKESGIDELLINPFPYTGSEPPSPKELDSELSSSGEIDE